ncbi:hypothetical protein NXH39_30995, partial [Klebsiella pneumoniae]|nr:hypothetical protein [Klebsiella pneumoniae]
PVNNNWKEKATNKIKDFKNGKVPNREDTFTINGITGKVFDMFNVIFDEFINMIEGLMGAENKKDNKADPLFDLKYTDAKIHANSKGCKV